MKKIFYLISISLGLLSCESGVNINIENSSNLDRSEIVEIPTKNLKKLSGEKSYTVTNINGEIIASQVTYDGNLIFQAEVKANGTSPYTIKAGDAETYPSQTYGRFITERKDDFAWENDRVAFRVYGPALVETDGPSNGVDLWYKRTNNLIIDKWYKDDIAGVQSYHDDHGEGLDDYKVGRTLGGGMMAPFKNGSLTLNENFAKQEIFENGPLRTTFKLTYKDITVDGKTFSESRTISIDAGSQMTKVIQEYGTKDTLAVAAGIVKRAADDDAYTAYTESGVAAVIYEEPESEKVGKVFVGMAFPKGVEDVISHTYSIIHPKSQNEETHSHVLGVTSYYPGEPMTYYIGFGWEKFGYPTLGDFQNYMMQFTEALESPLVIKIL